MSLNFLLIEDDEIERLKFSRVMKKNEYNHQITEAENGEIALEILEDTNRELPDVVLLDLNMPKMNGLEFLKKLKSSERLHHIPVLILSTSNNNNDLKECYKAGIAGYIVKPLKYEEYQQKIKALIEYWNINELIKQ